MKAPVHSLFLRSRVAAEPASSRSCELRTQRPSARLGFAFLAASLSISALFGSAPAFAQSKRAANAAPAVLLATSGGQASGTALDSVIGAALDDLHVVNVVARPGMDLSAVQLALDCVAETAQCLRTVTTQNAADVLIAPNVSRTAGELVLTILHFDSRSGQMRRAAHRQQGQTLNSSTLDAVPGMLRELFDLPPPQPKAAPVAAPASQPAGQQPTVAGTESSAQEAPAAATEPLPEAPMEAPGESKRVPVGPLLLGGGGLVIVGAGVVMGLVMNSSQKSYDDLTMPRDDGTITVDNARAADEKAKSAKTQAVVADVLFGVGGAALIGAGIWLAVELTRRPDQSYEHVRVSPMVGPNQLGLMLTTRGAGL